MNADFLALIEAIKANEIKTAEDLFYSICLMVADDLNFKEFSAVTIIRDLREINEQNPKWRLILEKLLEQPLAPLSELAKDAGMSKQGVHKGLIALAVKYPWIDMLNTMRGFHNERGQKEGVKEHRKQKYAVLRKRLSEEQLKDYWRAWKRKRRG